MSGRQLLLVTGMSGAGRTSSLKALEDMGYEAVDNLPIALLDGLANGAPGAANMRLAIGVDVRTRDFDAQPLVEHIQALRRQGGQQVSVLFLDGDDAVLLRRYTESRRPHPLALDRPLIDGIVLERRRLAPLRAAADVVIDTSNLTPAQLRANLRGHFAGDEGPRPQIFIKSFSYRMGVPRDADIVFDVRFLTNPHYDARLRGLTGLDGAVGKAIEVDPDFSQFLANLTRFLDPLLPRFEAEGKSYLTIAIGCTGGRHRSVYVAERLAQWFKDRTRPVTVLHRDLGEGLPGDEGAPHSAGARP